MLVEEGNWCRNSSGVIRSWAAWRQERPVARGPRPLTGTAAGRGGRHSVGMVGAVGDEDINTSATITPSVDILGPITRS
jgi:hypothetical protein